MEKVNIPSSSLWHNRLLLKCSIIIFTGRSNRLVMLCCLVLLLLLSLYQLTFPVSSSSSVSSACNA
ncbi:hypothetical protein YC2023_058010 [Brassica napus]